MLLLSLHTITCSLTKRPTPLWDGIERASGNRRCYRRADNLGPKQRNEAPLPRLPACPTPCPGDRCSLPPTHLLPAVALVPLPRFCTISPAVKPPGGSEKNPNFWAELQPRPQGEASARGAEGGAPGCTVPRQGKEPRPRSCCSAAIWLCRAGSLLGAAPRPQGQLVSERLFQSPFSRTQTLTVKRGEAACGAKKKKKGSPKGKRREILLPPTRRGSGLCRAWAPRQVLVAPKGGSTPGCPHTGPGRHSAWRSASAPGRCPAVSGVVVIRGSGRERTNLRPPISLGSQVGFTNIAVNLIR